MKPRKKTADETGTVAGPSFEQAIEQLEKIVADMENAELPLEELLKKYEEGTTLVRFCTKKLDEAEQKIEMLTKRKDGTVELKPFAAEETGDKNESEESTEDETRLF
jgi:exodeoxyribonuclease VII small subunit